MRYEYNNNKKYDKNGIIEIYNWYYRQFKHDTCVSYNAETNSFCISQTEKDVVRTIYLPFLAVINREQISEDKVNNCSVKIYVFVFLTVKNEAHLFYVNDNEINNNAIMKAVRKNIVGYGPISDEAISKVFRTAVEIAQFKISTEKVYIEEGLSLDNTSFIYRGTRFDITQKSLQITDNVKGELHNIITDILSCCKEPAVMMILLELELISLLYEAFLKTPDNYKMKLIPTFLIFIYGESGSGKTTISKAFFHALDSERYIYFPSSTPASMQNAIKSVSSGTLLFDDIPHAGFSKCSPENKNKLEMLIRAAGDFGAEKRTAQLSELPPSPKRVMIAVTSEAPFFISDSSTLRCLYLPIDKGSIDFEKFGRYRDSGRYLDLINEEFIKWAFSELLECNGSDFSVPLLETVYPNIVNETREIFSNVIEQRAMDNFIHLELYWRLFSEFLTYIGFTDSELSEMKTLVDDFLKRSAGIQQSLIKSNSAEEAIRFTLEKTITSNHTIRFNRVNNQMTRITLDQSQTNEGYVAGYYDGSYLILTSEHQKCFFQNFRDMYSEKLMQREIIDLLYKMELVVKPMDGSPLLSRPTTRTKIKINNIERDVIVLRYKSGGVE